MAESDSSLTLLSYDILGEIMSLCFLIYKTRRITVSNSELFICVILVKCLTHTKDSFKALLLVLVAVSVGNVSDL